MKITAIDGSIANCTARGITRDINIFMFETSELEIGDYVMVHVGYAIQRIEPDQALLAWDTDKALKGGNDA